MKRLIPHLLITGALITSAALLVAQEKKAFANESAPVEQTLLQMERDWNQATLTKDFKTLNRIIAEDWIGVDFKGVTTTKAESIAELRAGESRNESVELGDMTVRVYGNSAVVIGSDVEKSRYQGKDSSGKYAWMDVFVKRNGRWQAVASESTKISK
jgi:ketosteroid isomerase-like protein